MFSASCGFTSIKPILLMVLSLLMIFSSLNIYIDTKLPNENEIKENSRNIKILINYYLDSLSVIKKNINNDTLFLVFNESANFDIFKDEKNFTSILLYKNTGISLPKDTIINSKYNKNVLLLEIINKDIEQILTK